jgi:hypothetical protein
MTSEQLLRRVRVVNRRAARAEIDRALTIVTLGHTRLGDVVQAITNLRYLKAHLRIRHLDINLIEPAEHRIAAEILKHDPLIDRCLNLPYQEIPYGDYQAVLHYTVFEDGEMVRVLADHYERFVAASSGGIAFHSLPASQWDLQKIHGDRWRDFAYPLPLLNVTPGLFQGAVGDHQVYLDEDERAWAARWLVQAGVDSNDAVIVFVDEASVREKELRPQCSLRLLEHFLSIDRVKVLVYDVRDRGKKESYRERLSPERFEKIVFAVGQGLRRDLALLAAPNVKMILGPDTGIMHCAAGVHSALVAQERTADVDRPLIVVYGGRWLGFNMWNFWANSSACCVVPYETGAGVVLRPLGECPGDDAEFQKGLRGVPAVSDGVMIEFLESRFGQKLKTSGLLRAAPQGR